MNTGFRERLTEVLKKKGLNISRLAEELGVSRQTLYNWLDGQNITPENLQRLAEFLDVDRLWLKEGISPNEKSHAAPIQAQELIREVVSNETRLRLAAKAARLAVFEYDLLSDTLSWGQESFPLCEIEFSQAYRQLPTLIDAIDYSYKENFVSTFNQILNEAETDQREIEAVINLPDGCSRDLRVWLAARMDGMQRVNGVIGAIQDITKRKQQKAEQQQLKTILDQTLDCIFTFDADSLQFNYVNQGAIAQVGYCREELLTMTPLDIKPGFTMEGFRKMIAPMLSGEEKSLTFETIHRHKDGSHIPVEVFVQYIDCKGSSNRFFAAVRDISERKQKEDELRERKARLRSIMEATTDSIVLIDSSGSILSANQVAARERSTMLDSLIGKPVYASFPEEIRKSRLAVIRKAIATKATQSHIDRLGQRHFEHTIYPITSPLGACDRLTIFCKEITDKVQSRHNLVQQQEHYQKFCETLPECVAMLDREGYIDCNQLMLARSGCTDKEAFCRLNPVDLSPPRQPDGSDSRQRMNDHIEEAFDQGNTRFEWEALSLDGDRCQLDILMWTIDLDDRQVLQMVARDITEQKQTEERLRHLNRTYALVTQCNQTLLHADSEPELLEQFCHRIITTENYRLAWVGYAQEGDPKKLSPVGKAGHDDGFIEVVKLNSSNAAWHETPCRVAVENAKAEICQNIQQDTRCRIWRELIIKQGYQSMGAFPLKSSDEVFGALVIYADKTWAFDEEETGLLQSLADNLSLGIQSLRYKEQSHQ